ncbi:hypothetical protein [Fictibacillus phosphorivorans]|uniref:hypothetical protein n=1 Tax=Fictibacillus phosphorivorans TaxID=1221500 RepID=UPI0035EC6B5D
MKMDLNRIYKALYLYHEEGYSNINKIADEAQIYPKQVKKLIEGKGFKKVLDDFKADQATRDFTRVYAVPKLKKLKPIDYTCLKDTYLSKLMSNRATLEDIQCFLLEDDVEPKQADKMYKELESLYNTMYQNMMEIKLFNVLEVLKQPNKWAIGNDGKIIDVYPHPVLNDELRIVGIEYKKEKNYLLPEELLEVYCKLQDKIESVNKHRGAKNYYVKGKKSKYPAEVIEQWIQMREFGCSYPVIAEKYNVPLGSVSYHINKYKNM